MGLPFYNANILVVDDQEANVLLLNKMLQAEGYENIFKTSDSREVMNICKKVRPDLILLDLKMPYLDGFEILEQLKVFYDDSYLPVIVLTAYTDKQYLIKALQGGARDYIQKPFDRLEVINRIHNILEVRLLHNKLHNQNIYLEEKVQERTKELMIAQQEIITHLGRAAEFRDNETGYHIIRMSHYAYLLAKAYGMEEKEAEVLLHASKMHDIGKIGIPDYILLKPGKLDVNEWEIMKTHTTIGARILSGGNSNIIQMAEIIALTHHEKWDGTGYPNNLKGEEIPLIGRISTLGDVFDALTSNRPYKKAWTISDAVEEILKGKGTSFDPKLVDIFMDILPQIIEVKNKYMD